MIGNITRVLHLLMRIEETTTAKLVKKSGVSFYYFREPKDYPVSILYKLAEALNHDVRDFFCDADRLEKEVIEIEKNRQIAKLEAELKELRGE